eukprot:11222149-Alexandrium_andersonii.AAC.1
MLHPIFERLCADPKASAGPFSHHFQAVVSDIDVFLSREAHKYFCEDFPMWLQGCRMHLDAKSPDYGQCVLLEA